MVFSSLVFLFVFLPIVLILYYISNDKLKNYILLVCSLFFYAWGEPKYIFLMVISISVNYIFSIKVSKDTKTKKLWLIFSLTFNLGILIVFKYTNFFVKIINSAVNTNWHLPYIPLPLGISFFTFQIMSYLIDVYRNDSEIQKNIFDLALYISLFPKLIVGPIVQYRRVGKQIRNRKHSLNKFALGVERFIIGLGKKVIFSEQLGVVADAAFNSQISDLSVMGGWLGVLCYNLQIYYDFSGYSDMAIGLGKMFGFDFPENFNYPYISQSISEFWRRWHISLGNWFRDYVYIPLGGNRSGLKKQCRNLFIVWLLTGIWHGADWTFIVWGLYYGVLIIFEKLFMGRWLHKLPEVFRHVYLLFWVMIGWIFFRSESIIQAKNFIKVIMGINDSLLYDNSFLTYIDNSGYLIILAILFSTNIIPKMKGFMKRKNKNLLENNFGHCLHSVFLSSILFIVIILLVNSTYKPFLYFNF